MRVVCPMCETPGFTSTKAAGRDVKCPNPECLVPIFKAPEIKKKVAEPVEEAPPTDSGTSASLKVGIVVAVVVCLGLGGWFFFGQGKDASTPAPDLGQIPAAQTSSSDEAAAAGDATATETPTPQSSDTVKPEEPSPAPQPALKPAELIRSALEQMVQASQQRTQNRSKPFCRRLTADAYAQIGDVDEVGHQLEQLEKVGQSLPYFQITPLVTVAWGKLESGDSDGAQAAIAEAWSRAQRISSFGQTAADTAIDLSALLVAVDRLTDARTLMESHLQQASQGQLATLLRLVRLDRTFDLDAAVTNRPIQPWKSPEWVAVTMELVARNRNDEALVWAQAAPDAETRIDALSAWASWLATQAGATDAHAAFATIEAATRQLTADFQARLFARVAFTQIQAGDNAAAQKSLDTARRALERVVVPKAFRVPAMSDLYDLQPIDALPLRTAAIAAANLARCEALLGNAESAWTAMSAALNYLRASAPSPTAAQARYDEFDQRGRKAIEAELKRLFKLKSNEQARLAANRYRKQCQNILTAANERFQLQTSLLEHAADWNVLDPIWNEIQARADSKDPNDNEPFFSTSLPRLLAARFQASGDIDKAKSIEKASGTTSPSDVQDTLQTTTLRFIANNQVRQAAEAIQEHGEQNPKDSEWSLQWMLQTACRLVNKQTAAQALDFVSTFKNPIWRETGFELIAALAASNGIATDAWHFVQTNQLSATERVALLHGLVISLSTAK